MYGADAIRSRTSSEVYLVVDLLQRPLDLLLPKLSFDRLSLQVGKQSVVATPIKQDMHQRRQEPTCHEKLQAGMQADACRTLAAATASASSSASLPLPSPDPSGPALPPRWKAKAAGLMG